ncbi:MAG: hypothetical protein WCD18_13125 [Thermosynechococcaceae cyanobacterium]
MGDRRSCKSSLRAFLYIGLRAIADLEKIVSVLPCRLVGDRILVFVGSAIALQPTSSGFIPISRNFAAKASSCITN